MIPSAPIGLGALASMQRQQHSMHGGLAFAQQSHSMAYMIPDVPWYDFGVIGWAGSNIPKELSEGHGFMEQVFVDGLDNFLSFWGLALSIRASLPLFNGFILPEAPEIVQTRVFPFLQFICDPYIKLFQEYFPYRINGFDFAVFPAFAGIMIMMTATEAFGYSVRSAGTSDRETTIKEGRVPLSTRLKRENTPMLRCSLFETILCGKDDKLPSTWFLNK